MVAFRKIIKKHAKFHENIHFLLKLTQKNYKNNRFITKPQNETQPKRNTNCNFESKTVKAIISQIFE